MKEKDNRITRQYRLAQLISSVVFKIFSSITLLVAGIFRATSAVLINGRIDGGIVAWTACTDPTPDSVNPYLQAFRNYCFVSTHPYFGLSIHIPATCIINKHFYFMEKYRAEIFLPYISGSYASP